MLSCNWKTGFQDDVSVCYKGFSVIPSILLGTDPMWKDNVGEFCDHYRQDIPNQAGLPAELLLWERMWKEKRYRMEDIPDSIGATLDQIDKDAYVNIYSYFKKCCRGEQRIPIVEPRLHD